MTTSNRLPILTVEELRSPLKIANHRKELIDKIAFGTTLGLYPLPTDNNMSWKILTEFRKGSYGVKECVKRFASLCDIPYATLYQEILNNSQIPNLEIHTTDRCNLRCHYCSFSRNKHDLQMKAALTTIEHLKPKCITFSGGGENMLYKDFPSLIEIITTRWPAIKLGWITNGSIQPPLSITKALSWVRISVDSASEETHIKLKGAKGFNTCMELMSYLLDETEVTNIGLGFLFHAGNIHDIVRFITEVWNRISSRKELDRNRINIQFRPLRPEYDTFSDIVSGKKIWEYTISEMDILEQLNQLNELDTPELLAFIENQTNINTITIENLRKYWMAQEKFSFCSVSLLYTLLRADGSLYSCIHKGDYLAHRLGHIPTTNQNSLVDNLVGVTLLRYWYSGCNTTGCDPAECRYSHLNHLSESNYHMPLKIPQIIRENPFW